MATDQRSALIGAPAPAPGSAERGLSATVQWCGLNFSVGEKQILKDVSGELAPGKLAAILGPSGAGKSTLLNVLAGRQRTSGDGFSLSGCIEFGSEIVTPSELKRRVAFVMQDDSLLATQTVEESLLFSSALKLPQLSAQQRAAEVDSLLDALGLSACRSTSIGSALVKGVSGGERKRTSVGVELITNPSIVLLDEPTSGLDSFAASELVRQLKGLAQRGRVVCCTIHQPSSEVFELFDSVMCLRRGEVLYQGLNNQLLDVLTEARLPCPSGYSAADWLLMVAQAKSDDECSALASICNDGTLGRSDSRVSMLRRRISNGSARESFGRQPLPEVVKRASFFKQVGLITKRDLLNVRRDKKSLGARMGTTLGQAILYALIFGGIGKDDTNWAKNPNVFGALVSMNIAGLFGSAQPLLLSFPLERPVFLREYSSNMYSIVAYFLGKLMVDLLVTFLQVTMLVTISFLSIGLQSGLDGFLETLVSVWLMSITASSMALWLGCSVTDPASAIQLAPAIFVPQILFSGLFLQTKDLPVYLQWVQYVCALKYGINLACIVEFGDGRAGGEQLLDSQNIKKELRWTYILILLGLFVGFRLLALATLKKKSRFVF